MTTLTAPPPPASREPRREGVSPWWMAAPAAIIVANFVAAQLVTTTPTRDAVYNGSLISASLAQDAVIVVYVLAAALVSAPPARAVLALSAPPRAAALRLALPLLVAMIAVDIALEPLTNAGREQGIAPDHTPHSAAQWRLLVLAFVAFALVAPLAEELLFRGLGFAALGRHALLLTSILFALAHALPALLVPVFLGGLALGWVRRRTSSLYPSLGMHMALNATGLVVALLTA